jgi:hypothetical protein
VTGAGEVTADLGRAPKIPETLEEATSPGWLSSILGAEVVAVEHGPVDDRVSTNAPVTVTLADGTAKALWIKGYFNDYGRPYRHAGVPEAMFYRELAATTGMRTFRCVHADADLQTQANVVVTEDVVGEGAVFLDSLSEYSADQAAESLEQLALLHASTWGTAETPWLAPRTSNYTILRGVAEIHENFSGPVSDGVPAAVKDEQRLFDAFRAVADDVAAHPWSVIHGDVHIGNLYLDADRRPTFCDWQLVQLGPWYVDVGYHLASTLTVEDRRAHEDDLVRHYLDRLVAAGVERPAADTVWPGLRRGFVHGFYLWAITLRVHPPKIAALLERLGTAVDDHHAYEEAR